MYSVETAFELGAFPGFTMCDTILWRHGTVAVSYRLQVALQFNILVGTMFPTLVFSKLSILYTLSTLGACPLSVSVSLVYVSLSLCFYLLGVCVCLHLSVSLKYTHRHTDTGTHTCTEGEREKLTC